MRHLIPSVLAMFRNGWRGLFSPAGFFLCFFLFLIITGTRVEDLSATEVVEMDGIIRRMENDKIGRRFQPGRNVSLQCARLTLDPVRALHRPLALYAAMRLLWMLSSVFLFSKGFRRHSSGPITYWFRRPEEEAAEGEPLVFIHGIGIGVIPYHWFLSACWSSRATFVVELPHISMQLSGHNDQLSVEQTVDAIDHMLRAHQIQSACFMGHSFGSICVTWIIKHRPHCVLSVVLLDPVCFLLFLPDVCQNFVYRQPTIMGSSLMQWVVHYFAKRELNIAHTLSRHFWWYRNILWAICLHPLPRLTCTRTDSSGG